MVSRRLGNTMLCLVGCHACLGVSVVVATPPVTQGTATTRVQYQRIVGGPVDVSGVRDYSGIGSANATVLGGSDNIKTFNSYNAFGRRTVVGALASDEALISHAFFKVNMMGDYFPDLVDNGLLTFEFQGIQFDRPVTLDATTGMLHVLWNNDQVFQLDDFYIQIHDHYTLTNPFRDFDAFFGAIFFAIPEPNYVLAQPDVTWAIDGSGTDTLHLTVSFPYDRLMNLEEDGQPVSETLPAPQGFLEPFHFHLEYVVVDAFGDADGDGDKDLGDVAGLQVCFLAGMATDDACFRLDGEPDDIIDGTDAGGVIDRLTGPR